MMRVEWIRHNGGKVLFVDFREIKEQAELVEVMRAFFKEIENSSGKVNTLSDVTSVATGPDFMSESKKLGTLHKDKIGKTAVLGITGLKRMLLKGYNMFVEANNPSVPFDTKEEALDYLVS